MGEGMRQRRVAAVAAAMSNGVPWAVATVPPWASAQRDAWIGPPAAGRSR